MKYLKDKKTGKKYEVYIETQDGFVIVVPINTHRYISKDKDIGVIQRFKEVNK